ncbi:type II secretion system protein N [Ferrimonas balearica]|uniref:type II secretion system protein N n=1 Tax=Ferrimonas balearica TaxID=44012 RepID=UPI001C994047|nr:type II secretion system protein N [Ferrimonas balearica]MBY5994002.1 type II secretion system protein N [Ferrimonas balearica]
MRVLKYTLLGVVLYLMFLLVNVPAALVWQLAPLPKGVNAAGLSGTLWQGQADQLTVAGRQLEQVSWELHPSQLLMGQAGLSFRLGGGVARGEGTLSYGFGGLEVDSLRFSAPLPWLLGNTRLPFRTQLNGAATLSLNDSAQGSPWCDRLSGRVLVDTLDVRNQFGQFPLGNLAGTLSCEQGNLKLLMDEAENEIGVQGQAMLLADNQVQVAASIRPTDAQPEDLRKALAFLGQPDGEGAYPFNYNGPIPGL